MRNDDLQQKLRKWEIELPEDPHFRASVWREISIRGKVSRLEKISETLDRVMNPRLAAPFAIGAVSIVFALASLHGLQSRERAWQEMANAYNSSINPISHSENLSAHER